MTLKEQVASLLRFTPRGPLQIAELLRAPLPDVADVILELVAEERIYTYYRGPGERLYLRKLPREASLTWEERQIRFEARSYVQYENMLK